MVWADMIVTEIKNTRDVIRALVNIFIDKQIEKMRLYQQMQIAMKTQKHWDFTKL